jgi:hypothetical protein
VREPRLRSLTAPGAVSVKAAMPPAPSGGVPPSAAGAEIGRCVAKEGPPFGEAAILYGDVISASS